MNAELAAAPFVGVPWKARGDDPATGWDCRGLVRYLRRLIFDKPSPGMGRDFYTVADVRSWETIESLVAERMGAWELVAPFAAEEPLAVRLARLATLPPGSVLLFEVFQRRAHIGLVLSAANFVHTFGGQDTTILRLDDSTWAHRVRGAYDTRAGA